MPETQGRGRARRWLRGWPWALLALAVFPAVWHFVVFENDLDGEFPGVERPIFSARPPAAYRLAEPGDTIDRVGLYASVAVAVLAAVGWSQSRRAGRGHDLWPVALGLGLAGAWECATPWPTFDGWHGLNPRALGDPSTPGTIKAALLVVALLLAAWCLGWTFTARKRWRGLSTALREKGLTGLLVVAVLGVVARIAEVPDVEPFGYWPRWAFAWGAIAFGCALVRALPPQPVAWRRIGWTAGAIASWFVLIQGGLWLLWYHRPIDRLKALDPGRIYISGMPTPDGLETAQGRHHFRTIINLFNEEGPRKSPLLPAEQAFAREHEIRYVMNPCDPLQSDAFLDKTLALARDPDAWPILVHCHGCMDRAPAWSGIYRFLVQGRPLDEILREIEQHRGSRPKASVTLLYNRVLRPRAPEQYDADPTADLLNRCAEGTVDPYYEQVRVARQQAAEEPERLSRKDADESTRRP